VSKWTDDKLAELVRLQAQGLTSIQIGELVGARPDVVRHYIKRAREKGVAA
jgi:DNA-binding CsgD family transcriptional regulator